jgi:hypothetical protein
LIEKLLIKDRRTRLGQQTDAEEILSHPFFRDLDLVALQEKRVQPEFLPVVDQTGLNNFDEDITKENPQESMVPVEAREKIDASEAQFAAFGLSAPQEQPQLTAAQK